MNRVPAPESLKWMSLKMGLVRAWQGPGWELCLWGCLPFAVQGRWGVRHCYCGLCPVRCPHVGCGGCPPVMLRTKVPSPDVADHLPGHRCDTSSLKSLSQGKRWALVLTPTGLWGTLEGSLPGRGSSETWSLGVGE